MLRRISTEQLEVGMYVAGLEGDWFDNPFWRTRFRLTSASDLAKLRRSAIRNLWIDDLKGKPVAVTATKLPARTGPRTARPSPDVRRAMETLRRTTSDLKRLFSQADAGTGLDLDLAGTVVREVQARMQDRPDALLKITRLKSRDEYSYRHSVAVCALVVHFGRYLKLDAETVQLLGLAALLHDVGKLSIPRALLGKPGKLTDEEMALMRTHPERGIEILAAQQDLPDLVRRICLHHHERPDGKGYPAGLSGEEIGLELRLVSICDVFDAVTSIRPYKEAWPTSLALDRMSRWHGQFDPDLLARFAESLGHRPVRGAV